MLDGVFSDADWEWDLENLKGLKCVVYEMKVDRATVELAFECFFFLLCTGVQ